MAASLASMTAPNFASGTIWTGDCLEVMRGMNSETVDLIYLDPPFNSNANYAAPVGSAAAGAAFKDTWTLSDVDAEWINLIEQKHPAVHRVLLAAMTDSDKSYLAYMAARLLEMPRLLKPAASIYLHCDPTMSHYLKLLMDAIFGRRSFRNEIIWCYRGGGVPRRDFARKHDIILRYSLGAPTFNVDDVRIPYSEDSAERLLHPARSFRPGRVYDNYQQNPKGKHPEDWWVMQPIMPSAKERVGYPTQKPLALLDRIIRASSNAGDMVLDPFCGCATTLVAADRLDRQWAGIDLSAKAAELVVQRVEADQGLWKNIVHRTDIPQRDDLGKLPAYNSTENRQKLYGEQAGDCAGCGEHFLLVNLTVDHIIARSKGGNDHIDNLQLLCGHCNSVKGDRGMEYLRTKLQLTPG